MMRPFNAGLSRPPQAVLLLLLLLCAFAAGGLPAATPDSSPSATADRFACDALKALDLSEGTGARVRLVEVGILPASGDQPELCRVNGFIEPIVRLLPLE